MAQVGGWVVFVLIGFGWPWPGVCSAAQQIGKQWSREKQLPRLNVAGSCGRCARLSRRSERENKSTVSARCSHRAPLSSLESPHELRRVFALPISCGRQRSHAFCLFVCLLLVFARVFYFCPLLNTQQRWIGWVLGWVCWWTQKLGQKSLSCGHIFVCVWRAFVAFT